MGVKRKINSYNFDILYQIKGEIINIKNEKTNKNIFTTAWHTQWRGRLQVLNILDELYSSCPRFLKRKYDKYIMLKNSLK